MENLLVGVCDDLSERVDETLHPLVVRLREAAESIDPRPAIRGAAQVLRSAAAGRGIPAAVGVSY